MDKLITLAEMHWNRMQSVFASLTTTLSDHGMTWTDTLVSRYPRQASQYYGELGAERFAVNLTISMIIGRGELDDVQNAGQLAAQWREERLAGFQVADRLRQLVAETDEPASSVSPT